MPITPEARHRLAEAMEARRVELRLRWQDLAAAGGISLKTLHSARTGEANISPLSKQGIEDGLRWAGGSIDRILSGGDPEPLPPRIASLQDHRPRTTSEMERKMAPFLRETERYVEAAEIKYFGRRLSADEELDPQYRLTGAQVFGEGSQDADIWDDELAGRTNRAAAFLLAAIWELLAEHAAERQRGRVSG